MIQDTKMLVNIHLRCIDTGAHARGVGLKPHLEFNMLQKPYCLRKGDQLFSHIFCLLIFRRNANSSE